MKPMGWIKRTGLLLLSVVYLFSTMGTVIALHYCRGKVVHIQWEAFASVRNSPASSCGKSAGMCPSCCKNELKVIKLGDVHQPVALQPFNFPVATLPEVVPALPAVPLRDAGANPCALAHAPPLSGPPCLYIRHCHFAI